MIYLLKEGAKPVPTNRKRRKVELLDLTAKPGRGTPAFGHQEMKTDVNMNSNGFKDITGSLKINKRNKTPPR